MSDFDKFLKFNAETRAKEYRTKPDSFWKEEGEKMALRLFKEMSARVPAYKKFLKAHKLDPKKIRTFEDFSKVPVMDKENYINKYKLNELCWDGKVGSSYFLSASSGSTGIPNFWPRSTEQSLQGASICEPIYKEYFSMDKKSTLYIVGFAMGTWIAGTYMAMATEWVAQKGYPITIVTPGLNKDEILRLVKLGKESFDQTIIVGYPPFVKDVVDTGIEQGLDWKKINIKFMFSGEAITESWRSHLKRKTGFKNILADTINIYGSADVGLVAHETVLTTFLRRNSMETKEVLKELFHAERVPSVNQYDPRLRFFEKHNEELLVTAPSGIPLVRYNTKDIGNVISFEEISKRLLKYKINIKNEFKRLGLSKLLWKIPVVYLFGRGKFSATIYGVSIFPEYIKLILDHPELESKVTGKFVISTEENKDHSQSLLLRVEINEKSKELPNLEKTLLKLFVNELPKLSSEYKHLLGSMGTKVYPKVILHSYGDPRYFPRGVVKKLA